MGSFGSEGNFDTGSPCHGPLNVGENELCAPDSAAHAFGYREFSRIADCRVGVGSFFLGGGQPQSGLDATIRSSK